MLISWSAATRHQEQHEHLDVVRSQSNFVSLSNRRLAASMTCQSLHRDHVVKAWCTICSSDTQSSKSKNKTADHSLRVDVCDGVAQHSAAALFQRGKFVMHELYELHETPRSRLFRDFREDSHPTLQQRARWLRKSCCSGAGRLCVMCKMRPENQEWVEILARVQDSVEWI